MTRVWKAKLDGQWYASVDGETYIPVSQEPEAKHAETIDDAVLSEEFKYKRQSLGSLFRAGAEIHAEAETAGGVNV